MLVSTGGWEQWNGHLVLNDEALIATFQFDKEKADPLKKFGSLNDSEARGKESPNITYSWSGITVKTRQQRRSLKDTIFQREPQRAKTILHNGKQ